MSAEQQATSRLPPVMTAVNRKTPRPADTHGLRLAVRSNADQGDELSTLLRQRLTLVAQVMVFVCLVQIFAESLGILAQSKVGAVENLRQNPWFAFHVLHMLSYLPALAWLRWGGLRDLAQLRRVEVLIFGVLVAFNCWSTWVAVNALLAAGAPGSSSWRTALGPWLLIITGYGTLIPNETRRCAVIVGGMATLVVAMLLIALANHGAPAFSLFRSALNLSVPITLALAIALVGSHRLERLRQESSLARRMGQYQLLRQIGAGGMGEVYLAEHLLLRRPCAIKLIRPNRSAQDQLTRFEREVRATATLSHPNTVQIFDYGHAQDGTFYYAMEYLPGLALDRLVELHGPLPPARAAHFLRQLCGSLHEAHSIGLIHRDIKPGNVMVTRRGGIDDVVKLLDFGLVIDHADQGNDARLTQDGMVTGTPAFASPEQATGDRELDARSDIYSLGCLGWYLLVGHPMFDGRTPMALLAAHVYETPPTPRSLRPEIPPALDNAIMRCLAKSRDERYANVRALEQALIAAIDPSGWTETDAEAWWVKAGMDTKSSVVA